MKNLYFLKGGLLCLIFLVSGCEVVGTLTDVGWEATKLTGKAVGGAINAVQGKQTIRLKRIGNSFFTDVVINQRTRALLMLDTGASNVLLSIRTAQRLGISLRYAKRVKAKLAGGKIVAARVITLKELRVGGAVVNNIPAIILEQESGEAYDGLLGMSFLNQFVFQIDTVKGHLTLQKRD